MEAIKTEIVDTKEYTNKLLIFGFSILYLVATFYIFFLENEHPNKYLSYISLAIYIYGAYIMVKLHILKPKVIGFLNVTDKYLDFYYNNTQEKLSLSAIKQLKLIYSGYASWSKNTWGNKNYLEIESTDGQIFKFEFLIGDQKQKNKLKEIFKNQLIKDRFSIEHLRDDNQRRF